jgi:hypothetical protein
LVADIMASIGDEADLGGTKKSLQSMLDI